MVKSNNFCVFIKEQIDNIQATNLVKNDRYYAFW